MDGQRHEVNSPPLARKEEHAVPRWPWWRRIIGWDHVSQEERAAGDDQRLIWRVAQTMVKLGLTQTTFSISGGYTRHVPEVTSVMGRPPNRVDIRILHSQTPEDFASQASMLARELGVAGVRVIPLGASQIRLELLPE